LNRTLEMLKVRRKTSPGLTFIMLAVLAAVGAAVAVAVFLGSVAPSVPVLVAAKDLTPGTQITKEVLAVRKYPKTALPSDRASLSEAEGKHLRASVAAGDPIRRAHLAENVGASGTVAARLAMEHPGKQGVPLPSSVTEGLPWVQVGDRLSLVCTFNVSQQGGGQAKVSKYVVWDAPVVWSSHVESLKSKEEAPKDTGTVVVALEPREAELVQLALATGTVKAAVNPAGVTPEGPPQGVAEDALRGVPAAPVQQPAPVQQQPAAKS